MTAKALAEPGTFGYGVHTGMESSWVVLLTALLEHL